jgi:hypothetical protein
MAARRSMPGGGAAAIAEITTVGYAIFALFGLRRCCGTEVQYQATESGRRDRNLFRGRARQFWCAL